MLDVLLESSTTPPRPNPATVFSVFVHTTLIVLFVVGREERRPEARSDETENVSYLIPFDRVKAPPPLAVPTKWYGMGLAGEGTGFDLGVTEADALTGPPVSGRKTADAVTQPEARDFVFDTVATAIDVDSVARVVESAAPAYPASLLAKNIEGRALVQFVVDTLGRVDTVSFSVIEATHAEFAEAVRAVVPAMRFSPAIMASHKVKQLVRQPFVFRILRPPQTAAKPDSVS